MDRRELLDDGQEALQLAMEGRLFSVWTSMPGIVQSVNYIFRTCSIQPAIQGRQQLKDGSYQFVDLPVLVDCPISLPSVGGFTLSLPLKAGDEVLVVIASRCIDSWWQNGVVGVPMELRMHDLSDGFAIPGIRSLPNATPIDPINASFQSDDGATHVKITPFGDVKIKAINLEVDVVNMNVEGDLSVDGNIETTGNLDVDGNTIILGEATIGIIPFSTHTHTTATNPSGVPA